jgi:starvation-inducible DNA-binding protein
MDANLPIGLNADDSVALCKELNALLCDLHVFCQNVRGFHWNVQGQNFFELHAKFEEFYADLQVKIDKVAERVLTLGGQPLHSMQDYVAGATIPEVKDVHDGVEAVRHCAAAFGVLLLRERALLASSEQAGDEGTRAIMSDFVREQEKTSWMLRAYLA